MEPASRPLSMLQAAEAVGLTYEGFRKRWKTLRRDTGFPSPFLDTPYMWCAEAVERWKRNRAEAAAPPPRPANDAGGPIGRRGEPPQVAAGRSKVLQMMGAGR